MEDNEKALRKLLRPAPLVNWARHNLRRLEETRERLRVFVLRPPQHNLTGAYRICARIAAKEISLEAALEETETINHPLARAAAREIVPSFAGYAKAKHLEIAEGFPRFELPYPIGRGPDGRTLIIPIRPSFVAVEEGRLKPYFLIGWSKFELNGYQKELLSTIICRAVLTHEYFLGSDAQILAMPRMKYAKARDIIEWPATMYGNLSETELLDQFERYGKAVALVERELRGE